MQGIDIINLHTNLHIKAVSLPIDINNFRVEIVVDVPLFGVESDHPVSNNRPIVLLGLGSRHGILHTECRLVFTV